MKKASRDSQQKYRRTQKGVTGAIYHGQISNSKKRGHHKPKYSLDEFREWCYKQPIFHKLYDNWVKDNYSRKQKPSADRIDNSKGYSFDNIRLTTAYENCEAGRMIACCKPKSKQVCDKLRVYHHQRREKIKKLLNYPNTETKERFKPRTVNKHNLKGKIIKTFSSIGKASKDIGVSYVSIHDACSLLTVCKGFFWTYAQD